MQTIPFEENDTKTLKKRKNLHLFLLIYMILLGIGIMGVSVWIYYFEKEEMMGMAMGGVGIIMVLVVYMVHRSWSKFKKDYLGGVKSVVQGAITRKYSHRNAHEFTINDVEYHVRSEHYDKFKKGDSVLISFAPTSKYILDIHGLGEEKNPKSE